MSTYLIYDDEGFIIDDIHAESYDDMLQQLEIVMKAGELGVEDIRSAKVHMILNTELSELADHVEAELREESRQDTCDNCARLQDPMREYVFEKLLSSLDQFVNELPNKENSTSADQEDKRMDLAKDIKGVVDGYKDELNIESVKLEIKVE